MLAGTATSPGFAESGTESRPWSATGRMAGVARALAVMLSQRRDREADCCHHGDVPGRKKVGDAELALLLAEYDSLREAAFHRMDHRVTLLTTSLVVDAAVISIGIERDSPDLLLVVPLVACLFGLLVVYHHRAISEIGAFIRDEIDARVTDRYPEIRRWHATRSARRPIQLLLVWHIPIVAATLLPAVLAIVLAMDHPPTPGRELLLVGDALSIVIYVIAYASTITRARRAP